MNCFTKLSDVSYERRKRPFLFRWLLVAVYLGLLVLCFCIQVKLHFFSVYFLFHGVKKCAMELWKHHEQVWLTLTPLSSANILVFQETFLSPAKAFHILWRIVYRWIDLVVMVIDWLLRSTPRGLLLVLTSLILILSKKFLALLFFMVSSPLTL